MLTTILSIVTFLLLVAVGVFLVIVSRKQFEMATRNRHGIRYLHREDVAIRDEIEKNQRRLEHEMQAGRQANAQEFTTKSLNIGPTGANSEQGSRISNRHPTADANKNRDAQDLHLTDRAGDRYASLAASKLWAADGVMLDGDACLETGVGAGSSSSGSSSSAGSGGANSDRGRICSGKLTDGLDIIGRRPKDTGSGAASSSIYKSGAGGMSKNGRGGGGTNADEQWEAGLRKVYVHDVLRAQGIDADELRVKGGSTDVLKPGALPTVFASKTDGKNHIRGDTSVEGQLHAAGDLSSVGSFSTKGGSSSEYNPKNKRTRFANPDSDGANDIRGNTRVDGNLTTQGGVRAFGPSSFKQGKTDVSAKDQNGNVHYRTAFPHPGSGHNVIRGDTSVSGKTTHQGNVTAQKDVEVKGTMNAHDIKGDKMRLANNTKKNNMVFEAGRTYDGKNEGFSALNYNGDHNHGDNNFDANKMRWRLAVDQRASKDEMFIDRFGGGGTWVPLRIKDGKIELHGKVSVCDQNGKNCKTL